MITIDRQEVFTETPSDVFDLLADTEHEPDWNPDAVSAKKVTPGPVGVGTAFSMQAKGMGTFDVRIATYDRPTSLGFDVKATAMTMRVSFTLEERSVGGTSLGIHMEVEPRGVLWLLSPLLGAMMRRKFAGRGEQIREGLVARAKGRL